LIRGRNSAYLSSLSLWERVGVRGVCTALAMKNALILTFSQREKE